MEPGSILQPKIKLYSTTANLLRRGRPPKLTGQARNQLFQDAAKWPKSKVCGSNETKCGKVQDPPR